MSNNLPTPQKYETKGTGVSGVVNFVRETFGQKEFDHWLDTLSQPARNLATSTISSGSWYNGELVAEMRMAIVTRFFAGDKSRLQQLGRFTATKTLKGVYKLAVKFGSPSWIIERLGMVFETFFRPGKVLLISKEANSSILRLEDFPDRTGLMEHVFMGFLQVAVELSGSEKVTVRVLKTMSDQDSSSELEISWI